MIALAFLGGHAPAEDMDDNAIKIPANAQQAIFAGGCFWCTEAVYERTDGVLKVESGYIGGDVPNPSYEQVCTGQTGHAEAIRVTFDPSTVGYEQLVRLHFASHDPTTLNRQGADVGTQYRSAIFTLDDEQQATAERVKAELDASGEYSRPIVTEITEATIFYPAENYHQNYYSRNSAAPYCQMVITPKLKKLGLADSAGRSPAP
ncbi:peptide-methionine (S)-S-oxide reductase MsrA [Ruficoccus amylovorans]|uniref:Peptide methionine sulfoxide reductase MsrA n=2 Tax=Ruficoccus amylovorans TaxID=1804625 RepID=A0A842HHQ0_9BACT|nr:peptide-methionine (S)-S-oxide reductase MsrA [Ruficoccus amylovorans]